MLEQRTYKIFFSSFNQSNLGQTKTDTDWKKFNMFNLIILLSKEFSKKKFLNKTNVCLDKRNLKLITQNWLEIFNNYLFNVSEDLPGITELYREFTFPSI